MLNVYNTSHHSISSKDITNPISQLRRLRLRSKEAKGTCSMSPNGSKAKRQFQVFQEAKTREQGGGW
jgi:hypothetical protein